jgi:predicted DNA-binding transcriptional regulator YafY
MNLALGRGRDAARSIADIAESFGVSRRQVERELEEAVKGGLPVIACERGVYLAQTPAEARAYADSLDGRIAAIAARSRALRAWADVAELSGQPTLWEAA